MTTISVPDMMCENCVKRITNALTAAGLKFQVSLETKTVTIDGCDNCVKTALSELEDLGFTPGSTVTLVSAMGGNVIVKVKESRVAVSDELARKIMV